jgi:hypothetical protein
MKTKNDKVVCVILFFKFEAKSRSKEHPSYNYLMHQYKLKRFSRTTLIQRKAGKWRRETVPSRKEKRKMRTTKRLNIKDFLVPSTEGIN